jgi:RNA polymerase sigma factor (sigma-70 family)
MSHSIVSCLAAQWFAEYDRLAYWVARRWVRRLLNYRAIAYSANDLEELAQDAVCRGYDRFLKRCLREICGQSERKKWVCQCVVRGVRDAVRSKSRFGSITPGCAVRDDAMNRYQRVNPGFAHGDDAEKQDALAQVHYQPVEYAVQRWELELIIGRELPAHLQQTALYAACGLSQEQSAILQGISARTVATRLREIRAYLDPSINVYALICDALESLLDKPRKPQLRLFDPLTD